MREKKNEVICILVPRSYINLTYSSYCTYNTLASRRRLLSFPCHSIVTTLGNWSVPEEAYYDMMSKLQMKSLVSTLIKGHPNINLSNMLSLPVLVILLTNCIQGERGRAIKALDSGAQCSGLETNLHWLALCPLTRHFTLIVLWFGGHVKPSVPSEVLSTHFRM